MAGIHLMWDMSDKEVYKIKDLIIDTLVSYIIKALKSHKFLKQYESDRVTQCQSLTNDHHTQVLAHHQSS